MPQKLSHHELNDLKILDMRVKSCIICNNFYINSILKLVNIEDKFLLL